MPGHDRPIVVGVGEVLWDLLPEGKQLGGAPANFAYHAKGLGADGFAISCVGNDALGRELLEQLARAGIAPRYIAIDQRHPTGAVEIHLDADGKPYFAIHEEVAWDYLPPKTVFQEVISVADAVCFGSLAQRGPVSRATISGLLADVPDGCLRVFDVNLRQRFYSRDVLLSGLLVADIVKLNDEELPVIARLLKLAGEDDDAWMAALVREYGLGLLVLTRGARGAVLLSPEGRSEHPGFPAKVADTVGAGDAFTAAVTMGVLRELSLDAINECANRVASYVCSRAGAMPELPGDFPAMFRQ